MRTAPLVALLTACVAGIACHRSASPTWTLYRSEALGDTARIHVATFDADDDEAGYNHDTCEHTRELYQIQPSNRARFWCEAGRFHARK